MSCARCYYNVVSKILAVVIFVCLSGMYVYLDKESWRRGRYFSACSI